MAESSLSVTELTGSDYEELDEYPIVEGYSSVKILFDKKNYKRIYQAIEPPLSPQEKSALDRIMDILKRTFSLRVDQLDDEAKVSAYLNKEVKKIANEYNNRIGKRKIDRLELENLL